LKHAVRMSKIGSNIRKIRSVKGLSQAAFADLFGLSRASVGAYEEGRAEPKFDVVIEIANYFSISLGDIFTQDLTVNQLTNFKLSNQRRSEGGVGDPDTLLALDYISGEMLMNRAKMLEQLKDKTPFSKVSFPNITTGADKFFDVKGLLIPGTKNLQLEALICTTVKKATKGEIIWALSPDDMALGEFVSGSSKLTLKLLGTGELVEYKGIQKLFRVGLLISLPQKPSSSLADRLMEMDERIRNLEGNA